MPPAPSDSSRSTYEPNSTTIHQQHDEQVQLELRADGSASGTDSLFTPPEFNPGTWTLRNDDRYEIDFPTGPKLDHLLPLPVVQQRRHDAAALSTGALVSCNIGKWAMARCATAHFGWVTTPRRSGRRGHQYAPVLHEDATPL
jgi:hypothetical protein